MKLLISFYTKLLPYNRNHLFFKTVISRSASTGLDLVSKEAEPTSEIKKEIEEHWKNKINLHRFDEMDNTKTKFYVLSMFPYPSGILHMGHIRVYTIGDVIARFYRMAGYNVLHPMGWDAFGLPAENAAIERQIDPVEWTKDNINKMRNQLNRMNYAFDWDREFSTCDPEYYKWTQELFLKLYERGLIYQKEAFVNWDPVDQTVLAEEQVDENNCSWRSGAKVEKKLLNQWFIRTTVFAESLFKGLKTLDPRDWGDIIKIQENWIGKNTGISFELQLISNIPNYPKVINIWTCFPEFVEDAKFVVISPTSLLNKSEYCKDVNEGIKILNATVLNPFNGKELPLYVSDKVTFEPLRDTYLGIPSISMDDYHFSESVGIQFQRLSVKTVMEQQQKLTEILSKARKWNIGGYSVSSRLQDWLISRQRYWGTPIPIIHCPNCGAQPVPRDQLPLVLPRITSSDWNKNLTLNKAKDWLNTSCPKCGGEATRESDTMDTFVDSSWYFLRYIDPTNTNEMFAVDKVKKVFPVDIYIGGKEHAVLHLYFARFVSHFLHSEELIPCQEPFKNLLVQGMVKGKTYQVRSTKKYLMADEVEETEGQFIEKSTKEPVIVSWEKMSKSKHNGIDPLELLDTYGIDTTRLLILADVAPMSDRNWSNDTIPGIINWQNRLWKTVKSFIDYRSDMCLEELQAKPSDPDFDKNSMYMFDSRNYFLKTVTRSITGTHHLSIAISRLQGLTNSLRRVCVECAQKSREYERALAVQIIMLAPFAPHFASELWSAYCSAKHHLIDESEVKLNKNVMEQDWPEIDLDYKMDLQFSINNQKYKSLKIPRGELEKLSAEDALALVKNIPQIGKRLQKSDVVDIKLFTKAGCDARMNIITKDHSIESVAT